MDLANLLGDNADDLLTYVAKGIPKEDLLVPGPDYVDRAFAPSDRSPQVMRSLQSLFDHGRLGGSGYVSILPVDQGIEHSAAASFAPNPRYFDPLNIVKLDHNELLTYPNKFDQIMFGSVQQAYDLGAAGVGATIYFGSDEATRQIQEVSAAFEEAHRLGMFTVLWCYLRNNAFKTDAADYHVAADLT